MAEKSAFQRVSDPADPGRCQGITNLGQCMMRATQGDRCDIHAGHLQHAPKSEIRNYRLTKWQARINEFADNDKVKSLREEIGVLRILLEEIFNKCNDSTDLLLNTGRLSNLVIQIEKLVVSCHKLESSTGLLLDKTQILQLADVISEIIARYVGNQEEMNLICEEITLSIVAANNPLQQGINNASYS